MSDRPGAAFLDRDGVINRAIMIDGRPHSPMTVDDVVLLDGVAQACERIAEAGHRIIVVTNQPEVARGRLDAGDLEAIHDLLRARLPITEIVACPHDDADDCRCRKPKPGMILDACERHSLDPTHSILVGDRYKDVEAGRRAGCATVLVGDGYTEPPVCPSEPDHRADSLADAVPVVLGFLRRWVL